MTGDVIVALGDVDGDGVGLDGVALAGVRLAALAGAGVGSTEGIGFFVTGFAGRAIAARIIARHMVRALRCTSMARATSTTRKATLLEQVFASLDDDEPRLVLADVLTQEGDLRGELIVVQCELATMTSDDPRRAQLEQRERALLRHPTIRAVEADICSKFPIRPLWRRGFVAEIGISANWLKRVGPKVFAHLPAIDGLRLGGCPVCYGKVIPELAKLRTLEIGLGRSEHIAHLDLRELGNVQSLKIRNTPLGRAIEDLCAWKRLRPRSLDLRKTSIRDAGARTLATARLDLDRLDVRDNPIGNEGGDALRATYGDRVLLA